MTELTKKFQMAMESIPEASAMLEQQQQQLELSGPIGDSKPPFAFNVLSAGVTNDTSPKNAYNNVKLRKSPTFKDSSPNISRKSKGELIEKKIVEFEDNIECLEKYIKKLEVLID
jgi:exonuclease VII small subunit